LELSRIQVLHMARDLSTWTTWEAITLN